MFDKIKKSILNVITSSRIVASLLGAIAFMGGNFYTAIGLYVWGTVSDFLDGFAARKLNAYSKLGAKLDAVSDKLFAVSLIAPSIFCGNLLMLIPLAFEGLISAINLKGRKNGIETETQVIGKFKTALLFPTMILGLIACVNPTYYLVLMPALIATTILQEKTCIVYQNVINDGYKAAEEKKEEENTSKALELVEISQNNNTINLPYSFNRNFEPLKTGPRKLLFELYNYLTYDVPVIGPNIERKKKK